MAEAFGKRSSLRPENLELVELKSGDFGESTWGDTNPLTNPDYRIHFNEKRWANVERQLEEIRLCWAAQPDYEQGVPLFGVITVETGYKDAKKVGLEIHPDMGLPRKYGIALTELRQGIIDRLKGKGAFVGRHGKEAESHGDMDAFVTLRGLDELNAKHVFDCCQRVLDQDVDPVSVTACGEVGPRAPSLRSSAAEEAQQQDLEVVRKEVSELVQRLKQRGVDEKTFFDVARSAWEEALEPSKAPGSPSSEASTRAPSPGTLDEELQAVRDSEGVAWIALRLSEK